MKSCPKCNFDYTDNTLEFCLEDGTRLVSNRMFLTETPTVTRPSSVNQAAEPTVNLPFPAAAKTLELNDQNEAATISQNDSAKNPVIRQSDQILSIAPVIVALAHNWWQWIYLNNQYYSSFSSYVFSANFLMWLLLLIVGAVVGLFALKRCQNKSFAVASLVILSINLILFAVPKR